MQLQIVSFYVQLPCESYHEIIWKIM